MKKYIIRFVTNDNRIILCTKPKTGFGVMWEMIKMSVGLLYKDTNVIREGYSLRFDRVDDNK